MYIYEYIYMYTLMYKTSYTVSMALCHEPRSFWLDKKNGISVDREVQIVF